MSAGEGVASSGKAAVLWFRKGLRIHDNPALLEAAHDAAHLYPIFILDPRFLARTDDRSGPHVATFRAGVNRFSFLLQALADLDASLRARGSRLLVLKGSPEEVLPRVFKDWGVSQLCFEADTEPYAVARDARVRQLASQANVDVRVHVSHTMYDTAELVRLNGGRPPLTMQAFTKLVDKAGPPAAPAPDPPPRLPRPSDSVDGVAEADTKVPTLTECGFQDAPTTPFTGGETEALARLKRSLADTQWVARFEKPATDPSAFMQPATTVLSPYLKFGCLSPRLFHARLLEIYAQHKQHSQPPVSLRGQLLWREFFYTVGAATPNFSRMHGNPICRQIDWDANEAGLAAWAEARTGFPWIDAIMSQLREWGWIHHLARHSVACFLTRGDLYCSWERGQEVFEELLLDADYYLNAANWQWLSASAFFSQYFRVYSPVSFGKKYDPSGKYIRRFVPALKDMPAKYIYEPWLAPRDVQERAACIIGRDYPRPIVDHATASKACMSRMAAAYKAGKAATTTATARSDVAGASGSAQAGSPSAAAGDSRAGNTAGIVDQPGSSSPRMGAKRQTKKATGNTSAAKGKRQKTLQDCGVAVTRKKGDASPSGSS